MSHPGLLQAPTLVSTLDHIQRRSRSVVVTNTRRGQDTFLPLRHCWAGHVAQRCLRAVWDVGSSILAGTGTGRPPDLCGPSEAREVAAVQV